MNLKQLEIMKTGKGFIAALDQSGGSTSKALKTYGVNEDEYSNDREMFDLVHKMRSRIIMSPNFTDKHIIGAILFEETMYSEIDGLFSADYLWDIKKIVPFLKVDKGLADKANGVQLMNDMPELETMLEEANKRNVFGTKMRSLILEYNEKGIEEIVKQQFDVAKRILKYDLMPIVEPEISIHAPDKAKIEEKMKKEIFKQLDTLEDGQTVMLKLTPPEKANLYKDLDADERILRIAFLSGGHSQAKANELLAANHNCIASFSRGFTEGLHVDQSEEEFNKMLLESAVSIYEASIT